MLNVIGFSGSVREIFFGGISPRKTKALQGIPQGAPESFPASLSAVAVVADRFDRAAFHGLFALSFLLRGSGLHVNERITAIVISLEIVGRSFPAKVAVNALVIDEELSRHVLWVSVCDVGHKIVVKCLGRYMRLGQPDFKPQLDNSIPTRQYSGLDYAA